MPRFDDVFLDCSLYLYRTRTDAENGDRAGGSGFAVVVDGLKAEVTPLVPSSNQGYEIKGTEVDLFYYAVSNRHVVKGHAGRPGSPVVRLNKEDGSFDVLEYQLDDWTLSEQHDLAVVPISLNPAHKYLFLSVTGFFLSKEIATQFDVGIGDEMFMVGRLVNHEGKQRNHPSIRWGHISMMPSEPIHHPSNPSREQESFIVEIHSISGYSGSPVFVRPFQTDKIPATPKDGNRRTRIAFRRTVVSRSRLGLHKQPRPEPE